MAGNITESVVALMLVLYNQFKQMAFSGKGPLVMAVLAILVGFYLFSSPAPFPVIGRAWKLDFRTAMERGNAQYPDRPFIIPFMDRTVILPISALPALKNAADTELSTDANMARRFAVDWTGSGRLSAELNESLKVDLSRNLNAMLGPLEDEAKFSIREQFGDSREWVSVDLMDKVSAVIALTTGRTFVGLPLSRNPRWSGAMQEHTMAIMMFSFKLRFFPLWMRTFVGRYLLFMDLRKIEQTKKEIASLLKDLIHAKLHGGEDAESEQQGRLLSWVIGRYRESHGAVDEEWLVRDHFTLTFAGIPIPTVALNHAMIDLAVRPELSTQLREEVEREIGRSEDGTLGAKALTRLVLLDSFLKESLRMNPAGLITWMRMTVKPVALPSGDVVPPNTLVALCHPRFNKNVTTISNAETFVADRWLSKDGKDASDSASNTPLSATGVDDLAFGYGTRSCSGRFFASAELKLIVAHLVLDYDFRLEGGPPTKRPENIYADFMIMPPNCKMQIRRLAK